jgi:WD40 repeat protein
VATIPLKHYVYALRYSRDGDVLAIGDDGGDVHLLNVPEKSMRSFGTGGRVTDLAFAARGNVLVSLGTSVLVVDFDVRSHAPKAWANESSSMGKVAISPDGRLIVSTASSVNAGQEFTTPKAWTIDGKEMLPLTDFFTREMGHRSAITAVAFSPDGALLAAASEDAIRLWDVKARKPVGAKLCGHTNTICDLEFSPDGLWLASAGWDGVARIWEVASGRQRAVLDADVHSISGLAFTPEGDLTTANWDATVHLWDLSPLRR